MKTFASQGPSTALHAWTALQELASRRDSPTPSEASRALELASGLAAPQSLPRRRRTGLQRMVQAGSVVEIEREFSAGSPPLAPTVSERYARGDIKEFVALATGSIGGRTLVRGESLLVVRREPEAGDWVVVATRRGIRIAVSSGPRRALLRPCGLPEEGRALGVVEAIVREGRADTAKAS